jgi:hypothetical protein
MNQATTTLTRAGVRDRDHPNRNLGHVEERDGIQFESPSTRFFVTLWVSLLCLLRSSSNEQDQAWPKAKETRWH